MGHLAWADAFVVTADSVSLISEACSTGYVCQKIFYRFFFLLDDSGPNDFIENFFFFYRAHSIDL